MTEPQETISVLAREIDTTRKRLRDASDKMIEQAETNAALKAERDALAAFKAFVHQRLDEAGIPTHPEGPHSAEGCRVGDRLDLLVEERDALRAALKQPVERGGRGVR